MIHDTDLKMEAVIDNYIGGELRGEKETKKTFLFF